jgi:adenylate cyclase
LDPALHSSLAGLGQALIEALRQNQSFSPSHRGLAAALAHLGRDADARVAAAHLLEADPTFTVSGWIGRGGQSNSPLLIEGLRKAGLPE